MVVKWYFIIFYGRRHTQKPYVCTFSVKLRYQISVVCFQCKHSTNVIGLLTDGNADLCWLACIQWNLMNFDRSYLPVPKLDNSSLNRLMGLIILWKFNNHADFTIVKFVRKHWKHTIQKYDKHVQIFIDEINHLMIGSYLLLPPVSRPFTPTLAVLMCIICAIHQNSFGFVSQTCWFLISWGICVGLLLIEIYHFHTLVSSV